MSIGMNVSLASKLTAILFLTLCALSLWALWHRPVGVLYAVAAVTAQIWTHHKGYDELVVLLMTVPLVSAALTQGKSWGLLAISAAVALANAQLGLSTLIPSSTVRVAAQMVTWMIGLIIYVLIEPGLSQSDKPSETAGHSQLALATF